MAWKPNPDFTVVAETCNRMAIRISYWLYVRDPCTEGVSIDEDMQQFRL